MTARDFIAKLSPFELERTALIFEYLAVCIPDCQLLRGAHLHDASDFMAFALEVSAEAKAKLALAGSSTEVPKLHEFRPRSKVTKLDDTCPRCGHVHQENSECGCPMGGGRTCRCDMEARA